MSNRFRDPALRHDYEMALNAYRTKGRDIWRPPWDATGASPWERDGESLLARLRRV